MKKYLTEIWKFVMSFVYFGIYILWYPLIVIFTILAVLIVFPIVLILSILAFPILFIFQLSLLLYYTITGKPEKFHNLTGKSKNG